MVLNSRPNGTCRITKRANLYTVLFPVTDRTTLHVRSIFQEAEADISDVDEATDRVQKLSVKLACHYCENEKNFKLNEFLESFREFCEKVKTCEQELETWRVNEEKAEMRRKTQAELAEKRKSKYYSHTCNN